MRRNSGKRCNLATEGGDGVEKTGVDPLPAFQKYVDYWPTSKRLLLYKLLGSRWRARDII